MIIAYIVRITALCTLYKNQFEHSFAYRKHLFQSRYYFFS